MQRTTAMNGTISMKRLSLVDSIEELQFRFANMKDELRDAYGEIARLRGTMAELETGFGGLPSTNVSALRRRVAFYCHPDRGGDGSVMGVLNTIFDFMENSQALISDAEEGGRA